ncbi:TetR/AcrR family transcriptional regulator [Nocardia sp. NPDC004568]|uniref:TetR/AcrR family transcriptional regulator n=1 Tax=Nocardia sp. NPDC004568 TaxID=3154551 RepID=UPI0033AF36B2
MSEGTKVSAEKAHVESYGAGGVRAARSQEARQRLLDAAIVAFAHRGFHGTRTRDISESAGVSHGTLYVHFSSKEDLLFEISRTGHERELTVVENAARSSSDPAEQLQAIVHGFVIDHARNHTSARINNYELEALADEHQLEILEIRRGIRHRILSVIEEGARQGQFVVEDAHIVTTAITSLGIDVARWYRDDHHWSPEQIASYYCGLAARMVGRAPTSS